MKAPKKGPKKRDPAAWNKWFAEWRYDTDTTANNEVTLDAMGVKVKISSVGEISFHARMHVNGERKGKRVAVFRRDAMGRVLEGYDDAIAGAVKQRKAWRDEAEGTFVVDPDTIPNFKGLIERYEQAFVDKNDELLENKVQPKSWNKNRKSMFNIYAPIMGINCWHLTRAMIAQAQTDYLAKRERETKRRPVNTVRVVFNQVSPMLQWAVNKQMIQPPALLGLRESIVESIERDRTLIPREWQLIAPALDAMKEQRGVIPRYILATACRRSMAVNMKWGQLQTILIPGSKEWLTIWCVPGTAMKQGYLAIFPIVGEAKRIIDEQRARPGMNTASDEYVFHKEARRSWGNLCDRTQKKINKASGTSGWHRHDLRRTKASILRVLGADMSVVKKLLAHRERGDRSTRVYVKIGDNVAAIVELAKYMVRSDQLLKCIEAGQPCDDLDLLYAEMALSDEVRAFMVERNMEPDAMRIVEDPRFKGANVVALRPSAHA